MMTGMRTGQVAAAAGVNLQTLRYYERRGLLAEPERTLGGHRLYPEETVTVLQLIKVAQRLGFTLAEISELLNGRDSHGKQRQDSLLSRSAVKLAEVEAQISEFQMIATSLRAALDAGCSDLITCQTTAGCPLPFADSVDWRGAAPSALANSVRANYHS